MSKEIQRTEKRVERNLSAVAWSVDYRVTDDNPDTHGSRVPSRKMIRQRSHPGGSLEPQLSGTLSRKILIRA